MQRAVHAKRRRCEARCRSRQRRAAARPAGGVCCREGHRAWGLAPEVARSVGVSCNRARRLWFAGPALDHLLTWRPAPLLRVALCLHCHSRANAAAVNLEHCRRRPPSLLPPAPASKAQPPRSVPQLLGCPSTGTLEYPANCSAASSRACPLLLLTL